VFAFVAEDGAVDSVFTAGVDELSPNKESVTVSRAKDDLFSGASKERALPAIGVTIARIVALVECEA
jgi:hypothetical protein